MLLLCHGQPTNKAQMVSTIVPINTLARIYCHWHLRAIAEDRKQQSALKGRDKPLSEVDQSYTSYSDHSDEN